MTSKVLTMGVGILPLLKLTPVPSHFGGCFRLQRMCSLRGKEGEQLEARALELGCLFGFKTHFCPEQSYIHLTSAKGVIVFHTNGWKAKIAYKVSCVRTQGLHVEGAQEMLTW